MTIAKPSFYKQADSRWAKKGWRTTDGGYSHGKKRYLEKI